MTTKHQTISAFFILLIVFGITHFAVFPGSLAHLKKVTGGEQILDLKPEFNTAGVYQRLDELGEKGREAYLKTMLTIDTIFPLCAFVFLFMLGKFAKEKLTIPTYVKYYWVMPALYLLADFLENISIAIIILNYPDQLDVPSSVVGYLYIIKRISMLLSLLIPLMLLLYIKFYEQKNNG